MIIVRKDLIPLFTLAVVLTCIFIYKLVIVITKCQRAKILPIRVRSSITAIYEKGIEFNSIASQVAQARI